MMMRELLLAASLLLEGPPAGAPPAYRLRSPDGRTEVAITVAERISYTVSRGGTTVVSPSSIALALAESPARPRRVVARPGTRSVDQKVLPAVREKRKEIRDRFNELTLTLEYIILDEGWSKTDDLLAVNPEVDMPGLLAYAGEKGVGVVPWVLWTALDKQFAAAFDQFERWGVKGLKVDFMQRDDQKMVGFYERRGPSGVAQLQAKVNPCSWRMSAADKRR